MADESGKLKWYLPEVRTIIPLNNYNIPRSLKKFMRETDWKYAYDEQTIEIVRQCASRSETWISEELIEGYKGLERAGHLHSVAVLQNGKLVGGLCGVKVRGGFFGKSMFSKITQASKSALIKLLERLNERGFEVLDVQFQTEHLKMFGAVEIDFETFSQMLLKGYSKKPIFK